MGVFSPDTWNDVGVVALLIIVIATMGLAFKQGWIVTGFTYRAMESSHKEITEIWKMSNEQLRARSDNDQETIQVQASTISEQKVSAELTEHVVRAIREASGRLT